MEKIPVAVDRVGFAQLRRDEFDDGRDIILVNVCAIRNVAGRYGWLFIFLDHNKVIRHTY